MTGISFDHAKITLPEVSEGPTPSAGEGDLYLDTNGLLHAKYDTGDVEQLSVNAGFHEEILFYRNQKSIATWILNGWSLDNTKYSELFIEMGVLNDGGGTGTLHLRPNGTKGTVASLFDGVVCYSQSGVASGSYRLNGGDGLVAMPGWVSPASLVPYWTHYVFRFWQHNDNDAPMHWQASITVSFNGSPDTYLTAIAQGVWLSNSLLSYIEVSPTGGALIKDSWFRIQQQ